MTHPPTLGAVLCELLGLQPERVWAIEIRVTGEAPHLAEVTVEMAPLVPEAQQGLVREFRLCRVYEVHAPHSAPPDPAESLPTPAPGAQPALDGGA